MATKKSPRSLPPLACSDHTASFPIFRVGLLFSGLVLGFHLIQWTVVPDAAVLWFKEQTASLVGGSISLAGIPCTIDHTRIYLPNAVWDVVLECTALTAMVVFASFVLAFPASLRAKAIAVAVGLPLLLVANVLRLVTLAWLLKALPQFAQYFHDFVWNVAFLFLVVLMWLAWISLMVNRERAPEVSC